MKLSKILVFFFLLVIIFVFLLFYFKENILEIFYSFTYSKQINLEFSANECDETVSTYDKDQIGVKKTAWENENTLLVKAYVSAYCAGETLEYPDYKIEGSNLILEYRSKVGKEFTECSCARELIYRIEDLPKIDYEISLKEKGS